MTSLAKKILNSAHAVLQIEYLKTVMEAEQSKRKESRNWLTPHVRAEFTNGQIILHSPAKRKHWRTITQLNKLLTAPSAK